MSANTIGLKTARKLAPIVLALLATLNVAAAPSRLASEAFEIIRARSWMRNDVDWKRAAEAMTSDDPHTAVRQLLKHIGDRHSFIAPKAKPLRTLGALPEVSLVGDNVGYIKMPEFIGNEAARRSYVVTTYKSIERVKKQRPCGWIIDLRTNQGGNMAPMLATLRPFLGDRAVVTIADPGKPPAPIRAGDFAGVSMPASLFGLTNAPVVLLIGPRTGSAGEIAAIAFVGRRRTRFLGQPTAGASTALEQFGLSDGSVLFLATALTADRNGKRYPDPIQPDELLEADASIESIASREFANCH